MTYKMEPLFLCPVYHHPIIPLERFIVCFMYIPFWFFQKQRKHIFSSLTHSLTLSLVHFVPYVLNRYKTLSNQHEAFSANSYNFRVIFLFAQSLSLDKGFLFLLSFFTEICLEHYESSCSRFRSCHLIGCYESNE